MLLSINIMYRKQCKIQIMKMVVVANVGSLSLDVIETLPKEANIQDIQDMKEIHSDQIDSLNQTDPLEHLEHLEHLDSFNQTEQIIPPATVDSSSFHFILEFIIKYFATIISSSLFFN